MELIRCVELNSLDKILVQLLMCDGNSLTEESPETQTAVQKLILELTKVTYNIRYCVNVHCPCHPEPYIEKLCNIDDVKSYLIKENLYDKIKDIYINYYPITVWDCEYPEFGI